MLRSTETTSSASRIATEPPGRRSGTTRSTPTGPNTVIKRNALNEIRAILAKREVRLLLLHTCTLGANEKFVQALSDRLQVRIRAHKVHVTYIGSTPIAASYEDDPPLPEGDHQWPMSQVAFEVAPGEVPSP